MSLLHPAGKYNTNYFEVYSNLCFFMKPGLFLRILSCGILNIYITTGGKAVRELRCGDLHMLHYCHNINV